MRSALFVGVVLIAAGLGARGWDQRPAGLSTREADHGPDPSGRPACRTAESPHCPNELSCVAGSCYTWCGRNAWGRCGNGERCVGRYGPWDDHEYLCRTDEEIVAEWNGPHTSEVMLDGRWFKMSGRIDLEALRKGIAAGNPAAFSTPERTAAGISCAWDADCPEGEACAGVVSSCHGFTPGVCRPPLP